MPRSPGSDTARRLRPFQDHPGAPAWCEGDVPGAQGFRARVRGAEPGPLDDRAQHDPHLVLRERRSQAAPHSPTEWNPRIALSLALEEALGAELERLRIEVVAVVDRDDRRKHEGPGLKVVAADLGR